jgi:hypothetical protein
MVHHHRVMLETQALGSRKPKAGDATTSLETRPRIVRIERNVTNGRSPNIAMSALTFSGRLAIDTLIAWKQKPHAMAADLFGVKPDPWHGWCDLDRRDRR